MADEKLASAELCLIANSRVNWIVHQVQAEAYISKRVKHETNHGYHDEKVKDDH